MSDKDRTIEVTRAALAELLCDDARWYDRYVASDAAECRASNELAGVKQARDDAKSRLSATERAYEEDVQVLRAALTCAVMARTKRDRERARKQANEALAKTAPVPF